MGPGVSAVAKVQAVKIAIVEGDPSAVPTDIAQGVQQGSHPMLVVPYHEISPHVVKNGIADGLRLSNAP
jgi:hypothetical protein